MAHEPLALAIDPEPSEDDYQAFCAALGATARGRAFLAEHARRQRTADTAMLLSAVGRLEGLVRSHTAPPPSPRADAMRQELSGLLEALRGVQVEIDAVSLAVQVAKLASVIEVVQQRLQGIVTAACEDVAVLAESAAAPAAEPVAPALAAFAPAMPDDAADAQAQPVPAAAAEAARDAIAIDITARPQQPALPDAAEEPAFALAAALTPDRTEAKTISPPADLMVEEPAATAPAEAEKPSGIPEVSWFESLPSGVSGEEPSDDSFTARTRPPTAALAIAAVAEAAARQAAAAEPAVAPVTVIKAGTIPHPAPFEGEDFSSAAERPVKTIPASDLLPSIMALSEDERTALFT